VLKQDSYSTENIKSLVTLEIASKLLVLKQECEKYYLMKDRIRLSELKQGKTHGG
jgi:hypothetical protein